MIVKKPRTSQIVNEAAVISWQAVVQLQPASGLITVKIDVLMRSLQPKDLQVIVSQYFSKFNPLVVDILFMH